MKLSSFGEFSAVRGLMSHQMYNPSASRGNAALGYGSGRSYESPMFRENGNGAFDMGFWDPGAGRLGGGGDSRYLPTDPLAHPTQGENSGGVSFSGERYMHGERAPADAGGRLGARYMYGERAPADAGERLGAHGIDRYVPMESTQRVDSSRYFPTQNSSHLVNGGEAAGHRGSEGYAGSGGYFPGRHSAASLVSPSLQQNSAWLGAADSRGDIALSGVKRAFEEVSNQHVLGTHTFGQNEAFLSSNPLIKRPRIDVSGDLPVYPQRPGAKDCTHYMLTRTCKFGANCKFDHPTWVPAGGIPDWKEVPSSGLPPERPGEPECSHYMKTGICKFGAKCKFHHPKERSEEKADGSEVKSAVFNVDQLPERPGEPECDYFLKTGNCKFGAKCKFDHPKDKQGSVDQKGDGDVPVAGGKEQSGVAGAVNGKTEKQANPVKPATIFNSKGLPIRPGESDCPFYLKMRSCKYGASCRFSHPEMMMVNPTPTITTFPVPSQPLAAFPLMLQQPGLGVNMPPQRPGQLDCAHYMKTGECKFGPSCKFNHPPNRAEQSAKLTLAGLPRREGETVCSFYLKTGICKYGVNCRFDHPPPGELDPAHAQPTVKLTLAGFPRREGEPTCDFYMKTGSCKYGATCKFDHPPPGEAIAKAVAKASTNEDPSNVENKVVVKSVE